MRPFVDDDLGEPSAQEDQDQMQRGTGDREGIEGLAVYEHDADLIGHRDVVGKLGQRDQAFHAGHGK